MENFDAILAQISPAPEQHVQLPEGWGQGRALFGGLTAAIAWQHGEAGAAEDQQLRAMTVSFVAPVLSGSAQLYRRVLRKGKNVTQITVEIKQEGEVVLSSLLTYGRARPSVVQVTDTPDPHELPVEKGLSFPQGQGVPEFTRAFDYRVTLGGLPFCGSKSREFGGYMRFRELDTPITIGLLLGLVDAWPPALLTHLTELAPASSLTWTIEFPSELPQRSTAAWWHYVATIDYAADGYGHTHAHIWDENGQMVAISRQTVTVFA
ncbi:thioesterase family protein [Pseudidiomarina sp. 1APR75-33.1]|uniref:thioesterase family protein n=1 Tax=Pseudidiomarina terrestris TaxID=2820060 RepID=UPI00264D5D01|nr:thioesterase family protein [Pseudidiomarina sp. 1APR75-33.1]MDN7126458.1 thioesterase family protein [Pseudidiomarina sp. 1APR75-33.1]